jgi:hypothetical protein
MQKFYFSFWGSLELLLSAKNCKLGILDSPTPSLENEIKSQDENCTAHEKEKKRRGEEQSCELIDAQFC